MIRPRPTVKVLVPGHLYELPNFENTDAPGQKLQFIQKEPTEPGSTTLKTVSDGTTNEAVIVMLIDRLKSMNAKLSNPRTSIAIRKFKEGLFHLEERTRERTQAGTEGTMKS